MKVALFLILFVSMPGSAAAVVSISEIAWMGSVNSANDEWIELYNNSTSEQSVDGWVLSDGQGLEVGLAGVIGAGQYIVLERTDDTSAPGAAFSIYTGALGNDGRTLTLKRTDGSVVDQVVGGENWENIGGDNITKETAQYASSGWLTALATPGTMNATSGTSDPEPDDLDTESETSPRSTSVNRSTARAQTEPLVLPNVTLALAIDAPDVVYLNQPVTFRVTPSGLGEHWLDSLKYTWNFGDLYTGGGKDVMHQFSYPGSYVVTVHASYARHQQVARHTITVLPVTFTLTQTPTGDILIHNNAQYEVIMSQYALYGTQLFTFPDHTVMLPQATIRVPAAMVRATTFAPVRLFDQAGQVVATTESASRVMPAVDTLQAVIVQADSSPNVPVITTTLTPPTQSFQFAREAVLMSDSIEGDRSPMLKESGLVIPNGTTSLPSPINSSSLTWPYLGMIALLTFGTLGVLVSGSKKT